MGFFKNMARNGLAKRLIAYTGAHPFVALELASANYPKPPDEEPLLPPIIPTGQVQRATAMFLEQGRGTLDGLFREVWGKSVEDYFSVLQPEGAS